MIDREAMLKAIDLAKGYGSCKYRGADGTPMCVIGQYVFLKGGQESLDGLTEGYRCSHIKDFGTAGVDVVTPATDKTEREFMAMEGPPSGLLEEPSLLRIVQRIWDNPEPKTGADEAKQKMRDVVDTLWPAEAPKGTP